MKTHKHLFERIVEFPNLLEALRLATRGRKFLQQPGEFNTRRERGIIALKHELESGEWRPGRYTTHHIHYPKKRMISAAPFRDRIVQHALCRITMPLFERRMIHDLYSNRQGKGTHTAIARAQHHLRRHRYVLKGDIRKFFPSMDHQVLKETLRRTIACPRTLELFDLIIDGSNPQEPVFNLFPGDDLAVAASRRVGLPIGNLTSQWFGGIYLDRFDHWVLEDLHAPGYVRYVDDFLVFGDSKAQLAEWREAIVEKLAAFRLKVNARKTRCFRANDGITFLGQRVWPHVRRLTRQNVVAARRRLLWNVRSYHAGDLTKDDLTRRWQSWKGHATQANAHALIENLRSQLRRAIAPAPHASPA
jgi:RNA-directed DNA polymerase